MSQGHVTVFDSILFVAFTVQKRLNRWVTASYRAAKVNYRPFLLRVILSAVIVLAITRPRELFTIAVASSLYFCPCSLIFVQFNGQRAFYLPEKTIYGLIRCGPVYFLFVNRNLCAAGSTLLINFEIIESQISRSFTTPNAFYLSNRLNMFTPLSLTAPAGSFRHLSYFTASRRLYSFFHILRYGLWCCFKPFSDKIIEVFFYCRCTINLYEDAKARKNFRFDALTD